MKKMKTIEAEMSVLGCILLDSEVYNKVRAILNPEDFSSECHGYIFNEMIDMRARGEFIDLVTLGTKLNSKELLKDCGGVEYLAEMQNYVPVTTHLETYAMLVKNEATRRMLNKALKDSEKMIRKSDLTVEDMLISMKQQLDSIACTIPSEELTSLKDVGAEYHQIKDQLSNGYKTGCPNIDEATGGMRPADFWVIAAPSSMGKTTSTIQWSMRCALAGAKVRYYTLEMASVKFFDRLRKIHKAEDLQSLENCKYDIVSKKRTTDQICNDICVHKPDVVFVDNTENVYFDSNGSNRNNELSQMSTKLQACAIENMCTIVLLAQVNNEHIKATEEKLRSGADPASVPAMMPKNSGQIFASADVVINLIRDKDCQNDMQKGVIRLCKNRGGHDRVFDRVNYYAGKGYGGIWGMDKLGYQKQQSSIDSVPVSSQEAKEQKEKVEMLSDWSEEQVVAEHDAGFEFS